MPGPGGPATGRRRRTFNSSGRSSAAPDQHAACARSLRISIVRLPTVGDDQLVDGIASPRDRTNARTVNFALDRLRDQEVQKCSDCAETPSAGRPDILFGAEGG